MITTEPQTHDCKQNSRKGVWEHISFAASGNMGVTPVAIFLTTHMNAALSLWRCEEEREERTTSRVQSIKNKEAICFF